MKGILRDELGGVEITVVNDWVDVSAGETTDGTGEKAGAELESWGQLLGCVLRCRLGGVGEESARTRTVGRAGSRREGVRRVRGTVKKTLSGVRQSIQMEAHTGVLGLMSGHCLPWIFWSRLELVIRPQARMRRRGLERVSGMARLTRFLLLEDLVGIFAKRS